MFVPFLVLDFSMCVCVLYIPVTFLIVLYLFFPCNLFLFVPWVCLLVVIILGRVCPSLFGCPFPVTFALLIHGILCLLLVALVFFPRSCFSSSTETNRCHFCNPIKSQMKWKNMEELFYLL